MCYDPGTRSFHVEHGWDCTSNETFHKGLFKRREPEDVGSETLDVSNHQGPGADRLDEFKAALLAEAGHA